MRIRTAVLMTGLVFVIFYGCAYVNVRTPYDTDLNRTPTAVGTGEGKIIRIKEPFSGYGIYAEFNSNCSGYYFLEYPGLYRIWMCRLPAILKLCGKDNPGKMSLWIFLSVWLVLQTGVNFSNSLGYLLK